MSFTVLPLTENIGRRALIYMEEYSLSHGIPGNNAIIAATAAESGRVLVSSNEKYYRPIKDIEFKRFRP